MSKSELNILRAHAAGLRETHRTEQRLHRRYPIVLDAEFELLDKIGVEFLGYGRTLNISTGGVLLATNDALPAGRSIKLAMNWPLLLEGVCQLRLVIRGRIVRSDGKRIAVQTTHREFRTVGVRTSAAVKRWLVVQDDTQQRAVNFQCSVILDETKLAEFVHEKADA